MSRNFVNKLTKLRYETLFERSMIESEYFNLFVVFCVFFGLQMIDRWKCKKKTWEN